MQKVSINYFYGLLAVSATLATGQVSLADAGLTRAGVAPKPTASVESVVIENKVVKSAPISAEGERIIKLHNDIVREEKQLFKVGLLSDKVLAATISEPHLKFAVEQFELSARYLLSLDMLINGEFNKLSKSETKALLGQLFPEEVKLGDPKMYRLFAAISPRNTAGLSLAYGEFYKEWVKEQPEFAKFITVTQGTKAKVDAEVAAFMSRKAKADEPIDYSYRTSKKLTSSQIASLDSMNLSLEFERRRLKNLEETFAFNKAYSGLTSLDYQRPDLVGMEMQSALVQRVYRDAIAVKKARAGFHSDDMIAIAKKQHERCKDELRAFQENEPQFGGLSLAQWDYLFKEHYNRADAKDMYNESLGKIDLERSLSGRTYVGEKSRLAKDEATEMEKARMKLHSLQGYVEVSKKLLRAREESEEIQVGNRTVKLGDFGGGNGVDLAHEQLILNVLFNLRDNVGMNDFLVAQNKRSLEQCQKFEMPSIKGKSFSVDYFGSGALAARHGRSTSSRPTNDAIRDFRIEFERQIRRGAGGCLPWPDTIAAGSSIPHPYLVEPTTYKNEAYYPSEQVNRARAERLNDRAGKLERGETIATDAKGNPKSAADSQKLAQELRTRAASASSSSSSAAKGVSAGKATGSTITTDDKGCTIMMMNGKVIGRSCPSS